MTTKLKLNDVDLDEIFATTTGNTNYSSYYNNNLDALDEFSGSNTTLKGTEAIGYQINGNDVVNIFHPKYYDSTVDNTAVDITIPTWCNKVAFILQSRGGKGGARFVNYWQKISIPQGNTSYGRRYSRSYGRRSYDRGQYITHRNWRGFYRFSKAKTCFNCDRHSYGRTQNSSQNTSQQSTQNSHFYITYFRNGVESKTYNGSGGGGGGAAAGIYNVDPNNRLDKFTFTTNNSLGYEQIYFESSEYATANHGGDVVANPNTYSSGSPMYMNNSDADNTTTDTAGTGGGSFIATSGKITNTLTQNGANGSTTSGTSSYVGGNGGLENNSTIQNTYLPPPAVSYGHGATGNSAYSQTAEPNNHILRYWFIR